MIIICLALSAVMILDLPGRSQAATPPIQPAVTPEPEQADLAEAVLTALKADNKQFAGDGYIIDHIQIQDDGQLAAVWLAVIDPLTGEPLGREPELALAERDDAGKWAILLSSDKNFDRVLRLFQYGSKSVQGDLDIEPVPLPKDPVVFGGYYLPWAQNLSKRLTWSVGHTSCTPTYYCTHAFDFADGTMFPLVAAKGGTVYHWKDTCTNGDTGCTNSITLQDRSTTPWTYQIYLHIARGSVPNHLKTVGTPVLQGQYIADVDDTGYSTGHHLHFMVVSQNTVYQSWNGYTWGRAEDITFRDVAINWDAATQGGRPRLAYEAASYGGVGQTNYISGNQPAHPPTGTLTNPKHKTYVTTPLLDVSGSGQDDIAVTKFEILADAGAGWVSVGEKTANPFSGTVDLCAANLPDGPLTIALRVWDYEGNPSALIGKRKIIKNVACDAVGSDPNVMLTRTGTHVLLPESGTISATTAPGSTGAAVTSVEFWLHGLNWAEDSWVNLGKDSDGSNGWQAPFIAGDLPESNAYTVVAVATDANGRQGADVTFTAALDKTAPSLTIQNPPSPFSGDRITVTWSASDAMAGLDHFSLWVRVNEGAFYELAPHLPASTTHYGFDVGENQLVVFELRAYDLAGNQFANKVGIFTTGYIFDHESTFPGFFLN